MLLFQNGRDVEFAPEDGLRERFGVDLNRTDPSGRVWCSLCPDTSPIPLQKAGPGWYFSSGNFNGAPESKKVVCEGSDGWCTSSVRSRRACYGEMCAVAYV